MSKFFDELMESVREMDEILRGECAPSRISKAGKMIQKNQQTLDEQPRFKETLKKASRFGEIPASQESNG